MGVLGRRWPWLVVAVTVLVTALVVLLPLLATPTTGNSDDMASSDVATLELLDQRIEVRADGTLHATERLSVLFPVERRGIFRLFDTRAAREQGVIEVDLREVTRDGAPEPWVRINGDDAWSARIGVADLALPPGRYTYGLRYQTSPTMERIDGAPVWWWDVIGSGWQMPILASTTVVTLPAAPAQVTCMVGRSTPCTVEVDDRTLTVRTGPLPPFTPVTLRVQFTPGAVDPLPIRGVLDSVLPPWWLAGLTIVLTGLLLPIGIRQALRSRESTPPMPVRFDPPAGVTPALGAYLLQEWLSAPTALTATVADLGERGILTLARTGSPAQAGWTLTRTNHPANDLGEATARLLADLGLTDAGDSLHIDQQVDAVAGARVDGAGRTFVHGTATEARSRGLLTATRQFPRQVLWGLAQLAAIAAAFRGGQVTVLCVPLLAYAVVAAPAMTAQAGTRRTPAGREVWGQAAGFRMLLATPTGVERFDFAYRRDLFTAYLPWAIAFGVADQWEEAFRLAGVSPGTPTWLDATGSGWTASSLAGAAGVAGFGAAVTSALAAYSAQQSSSGGGGGGGGGSGSGGGGGGSW